MNWRVRIFAVLVLSAFTGFAWLYYRGFVKQRSHGVILFVVNGFDLSVFADARLQTQIARSRAILRQVPPGQLLQTATERALLEDHIFEVETFPNLAFLNVRAPGQPVPDAGAAATALASGQRVRNGLVGCNALHQPVGSLLHEARYAGRATGLVTTSSLTAPTPVAFYSFLREPDDAYRAAEHLVENAELDVVLGGGERYFTAAHITNEEGRLDNRNLVADIEKVGYLLVRDRRQLAEVPTWRTRRLFGLFAEDQFLFASTGDRTGRQPSLAEMVRVAIQCLQYQIGGYFLVVEHGLIGSASQYNMNRLVLDEADALNEALRTAIAYAGENTLILVTNNISFGAISPASLLSEPPDVLQSVPQRSPAPVPAVAPVAKPVATPGATNTVALVVVPSWLSGPGGPILDEQDRRWFDARVATGAFATNVSYPNYPYPAAIFATQAATTSEPAWMASRGFGSSSFVGFLANTDVFPLLLQELRK